MTPLDLVVRRARVATASDVFDCDIASSAAASWPLRRTRRVRGARSMPQVASSPPAALASACLLGGRFSIVAISQRIKAWYRETVQHYGLEGRLASIRALDEELADIGNVQGNQGERLLKLAERCPHNVETGSITDSRVAQGGCAVS